MLDIEIVKENFPLQIGVWLSNSKKALQVKEILWPGHSHVPPNGIPEKFHLKVKNQAVY